MFKFFILHHIVLVWLRWINCNFSLVWLFQIFICFFVLINSFFLVIFQFCWCGTKRTYRKLHARSNLLGLYVASDFIMRQWNVGFWKNFESRFLWFYQFYFLFEIELIKPKLWDGDIFPSLQLAENMTNNVEISYKNSSPEAEFFICLQIPRYFNVGGLLHNLQ